MRVREQIKEKAKEIAEGRDRETINTLKDILKVLSRSMNDYIEEGKPVSIEVIKVWLNFCSPLFGMSVDGSIVIKERPKPHELIQPLPDAKKDKANLLEAMIPNIPVVEEEKPLEKKEQTNAKNSKKRTSSRSKKSVKHEDDVTGR